MCLDVFRLPWPPSSKQKTLAEESSDGWAIDPVGRHHTECNGVSWWLHVPDTLPVHGGEGEQPKSAVFLMVPRITLTRENIDKQPTYVTFVTFFVFVAVVLLAFPTPTGFRKAAGRRQPHPPVGVRAGARQPASSARSPEFSPKLPRFLVERREGVLRDVHVRAVSSFRHTDA